MGGVSGAMAKSGCLVAFGDLARISGVIVGQDEWDTDIVYLVVSHSS